MSRGLLVVRGNIGWILAVVALVALTLGTIAYLEFGLGFLDSLYGGLSLFLFAYTEPPAASLGGPPQDPSVALQIARFLAPLTTVAAGVAAVLLMLSRASDRIAARRMRDHTIICNPSQGGRELATNLKDAGEPVVVVVDQVDEALIRDLRMERIPVVEGNPTSPRVLSDAGAPHARRIVALPAEERVNFGIAATLVSTEPTVKRQQVLLFSNDLDTVDYLTSRTLPRTLERLRQGDARSSARTHAVESVQTIEWGSIDRIAALTLLSEFLPLSQLAGLEPPELLIVGKSSLSDAFVVELAKVWWSSRNQVPRDRGEGPPAVSGSSPWQPIPLRLIDPDAAAWREELLSRFPGIEKAILFREGMPSVRDLRHLQSTSSADRQHVAFVISRDPGLIIRSLAQLESLVSTPVRVVLGTDGQGLEAMAELGLGRDSDDSRALFEVSGFDLSRRLYTEAMLSNSLIEQLANLNHLVYLEDDHIVGRPADRSWEELDPADRESNRKAAIHHLGYKLDALGLTILPLSSQFSPDAAYELSKDGIEEMARVEHDRWMEEKLANHWTPNASLKEQDREKKEHPDLVPWESLSPKTKEQDRIFVRALPRMLRACGFQIVRSQGSAEEGIRSREPAGSESLEPR